jgi:3-deoxy-D-manno-octulosonate 8-phosphate phosphatase KdsC-like HAD superfamily phosphatase
MKKHERHVILVCGTEVHESDLVCGNAHGVQIICQHNHNFKVFRNLDGEGIKKVLGVEYLTLVGNSIGIARWFIGEHFSHVNRATGGHIAIVAISSLKLNSKKLINRSSLIEIGV